MGMFDFLNWLSGSGQSSADAVLDLAAKDPKTFKRLAESKPGEKLRFTDHGVRYETWRDSSGRVHVHGSDGTKQVF